jgi:xylulokinase
MFLLGYDIGSSSIKVALVNGDTNQVIKQTQYPEVEMEIHSSQRGWAEQQPEDWWNYLIAATKKLLTHSAVDPQLIKAIGLLYHMVR